MALANLRQYDQQFGTFAPSKDDIVGALSKFLGKASDPSKLENYSEHHAATCTFTHTHIHSPLSTHPLYTPSLHSRIDE